MRARSRSLEKHAAASGVWPKRWPLSTSACASRSSLAVATWPCTHAACSGVAHQSRCSSESVVASDQSERSCRTVPSCPWKHATYSSSVGVGGAFSAAAIAATASAGRYSVSSLTMSSRASRLARSKAVQPWTLRSGSAFASSSARTSGGLPWWHATHSGVMPAWSIWSTCAPA